MAECGIMLNLYIALHLINTSGSMSLFSLSMQMAESKLTVLSCSVTNRLSWDQDFFLESILASLINIPRYCYIVVG